MVVRDQETYSRSLNDFFWLVKSEKRLQKIQPRQGLVDLTPFDQAIPRSVGYIHHMLLFPTTALANSSAAVMATAAQAQKTHYLVFFASPTSSSVSWCSDCTASIALLSQYLPSAVEESTLIHVGSPAESVRVTLLLGALDEVTDDTTGIGKRQVERG